MPLSVSIDDQNHLYLEKGAYTAAIPAALFPADEYYSKWNVKLD